MTSSSPTIRGTVILVHGVGNQGESETAGAFTTQLGQSLRLDGYQPKLHEETVFYDSGDEAYSTSVMHLRDRDPDRLDVNVVEFYWADLSTLDSNWLQKASSVWRVLVGLPNFGLLAVEHLHRSGALQRAFSAVFTICWCLIVFRFIAFSTAELTAKLQLWLIASGMFGTALIDIPDSWQRVITIYFDLLMCIFLLLFGVLAWLARFRSPPASEIPIKIAITSLGLAALFTMHIPAALEYLPPRPEPTTNQVSQDSDQNNSHESNLATESEGNKSFKAISEKTQSTQLAPFDHDVLYGNLYSVTRVAGVSSYIIQFGFICLMLVVVIKYLHHVWRERRTGDDGSDIRLDQILSSAAFVAYIASIALLFVSTVFWLIEFLAYCWSRTSLFGEFAGYGEQVLVFCKWQVLLVALPILFPAVRAALRPIVELILDTMTYFPPAEVLRGKPRLAAFLGAMSPGGRPNLRPLLTKRLESLIRDNAHDGEGPTIIIAHSLGTVITYDTLSQGRDTPLADGLQLVTMGSPLAKLRTLFPDFVPDATLPVAAWVNLYRVDDYVGTRLPQRVAEQNSVDEHPIGTGGHLNYFTSTRLVSLAKRMLVQQRGQ